MPPRLDDVERVLYVLCANYRVSHTTLHHIPNNFVFHYIDLSIYISQATNY